MNTSNSRKIWESIGLNKIRQLSDREDCEFVLWVGTKRLIKRRKFDEYIEMAYSV
ncbi:MAG: transposase [Clostridia bacterium]|nr:transposase [Clostridia bacterium]MBP3448243.1 transposase [Clostridia bacterium]